MTASVLLLHGGGASGRQWDFYEEPLDWSAIRELPRSYVLTVHDTAVPTEMQETMAARQAFPVVPLASGHLPHVTMPEVIAALCDGAAADVERG